MNDARDSDRHLPGEGQGAVQNGPVRDERRGWTDMPGRAVFEILIVTVGVLLALAVDEWRDRSEQSELANQARMALRAEILSNREAVVSRLRRTAQLYVMTAKHPDEVGKYVFERRHRALLLNDAAWSMAVETGAIRWLTPAERTKFAEIYAGQQRSRDVVFEEMIRWTDLGEYSDVQGSSGKDRDRDRAIRVWQAWAHRTQFALCVSAGRYERTLGATVTEQQLLDFCSGRPPGEDPELIYREWKRLGWASSIAPRTLGRTQADR